MNYERFPNMYDPVASCAVSPNGCELGDLPANESTKSFRDLYDAIPNRILDEKEQVPQSLEGILNIDDGYMALFDKAPVCGEAHFLFCPKEYKNDKRHDTSFAQIENQDEVEEVLSTGVKTIASVDPDCFILLLSHGGADGCTEHPHEHVIVVSQDLFDEMETAQDQAVANFGYPNQKEEGGWNIASCKRRLSKFGYSELSEEERNMPYNSIGIYDPRAQTIEHIVYLQEEGKNAPPSQHLRRLTAEVYYRPMMQDLGNKERRQWDTHELETQNMLNYGGVDLILQYNKAVMESWIYQLRTGERLFPEFGYNLGHEGIYDRNKALTLADIRPHLRDFTQDQISIIAKAAILPENARNVYLPVIEKTIRKYYYFLREMGQLENYERVAQIMLVFRRKPEPFNSRHPE